MTLQERIDTLSKEAPHIHILSNSVIETEAYLLQNHWITEEDNIQLLEKPGEGNMNLVLRVVLDNGSRFILKQARPWVEKFPQIEAPSDRIIVEYEYYKAISNNEQLSKHSPKILHFDERSLILCVEDLGEANDFTNKYMKETQFDSEDIFACIDYLNQLSRINNVIDFPENLELRTLNFQHIFYLPFIEENGFDLDSIQDGLQKLSEPIKKDQALKDIMSKLGEVYLSKGEQLLHGDFYPGSMLITDSGLKVIDPEFGFNGPVEWDIAIFIAHLYMTNSDPEEIQKAYQRYNKPNGFDDQLFAGFVGTELIRRIIGLAQLPLTFSLVEKQELLEKAVQWIKYGYTD